MYLGKLGIGFNQCIMKKLIGLLSKVNRTSKPINTAMVDEKNTVWIEPTYYCELKFASLSSNDTYREPVFLKFYKTSELSKAS